MDAVVDRYFPILDELELSLETAESDLFDGASTRHKIEDLYALKRRLMVLKHAVAPLMEVVSKLFGGRVPQLCASTQEYYRDVYDHLSRINSAIETIREMLATATTVNIAMISLSESEVTKKLAAWGALITVPTLIAGIYGMNFELMPELKWVLGYPYALAIMLIVDALLFWRFRQVKWI
jgi:magnesium transporter